MQNISRRYFLAASAIGIPAALPALHADPLGLPIGCQTYPVRNALSKDLNGTLGQLAGLGYKRVEMCSPLGYERSGYGPLNKMKASEIRAAIQAAGLGCESSHFSLVELKNNLEDRIEWSKEMGLKQMVLATFSLPRTATLDDWDRAADELNKIAEPIHKAGMQVGFHNHNFEFQQLDGVLVYDRLMGKLDPKLVRMQFQVSVVSMGYQAATYLTKYAGRFLSMHLQDWSVDEKREVAVGKGIVDWPKLFEAAKKGGIKNYFVELDMPMLGPSYEFLHGLKV
jgi:sugar phosphate isomerase/epimerase